MNKQTLWSLRLGFSDKQSKEIDKKGLNSFLKSSFNFPIDYKLPSPLIELSNDYKDQFLYKELLRNASPTERKKIKVETKLRGRGFNYWWIKKMQFNKYPLREKMVSFWHNHFVVTINKVRLTQYIYDHHMILQEHAFGNFKAFTKAILRSNAMIGYLDNNKNSIKNLNENLARELLELFTLGEGNYAEQDIKDAAQGLAGLTFSNTNQGEYNNKKKATTPFKFMGKTGVHDIDDIVDIIFEQSQIPFLITRKILQWFIYDEPSKELINYYGAYFKSQNFEIQPLLFKIFSEEYKKDNISSKIKDPMTLILQTIHGLQIEDEYPVERIFNATKALGMELYNHPNVKGWVGGKSWLTTDNFIYRTYEVDRMCSGRSFKSSAQIKREKIKNKIREIKLSKPHVNNLEIIQQLTDRFICFSNPTIDKDLELIIRHDFDYNNAGAKASIAVAFNYIATLPEYQVI